MPVLPASVKPSLSLLSLMLAITLSLVMGNPSVVRAQTASTSGTASISGTASQSATTYTASSSGTGGVGSSGLPEELPASGSNDILISFAIGAFLILSGLIGRVTLVHVLRESDEV